jgi:hypothetical protein
MRTDQAAHFWSILVQQEEVMCQLGQVKPVLCHVEDVRVHVNVVHPEGIYREDLLELDLSVAKVYRSALSASAQNRCFRLDRLAVEVIEHAGTEGHDPQTLWEEVFSQQSIAQG